MAKDEDYELLPHEELERLRQEVEQLKANPLSGVGSSDNLLQAIDNMTKSINRLLAVLQEAEQSVVREFEGVQPHKKLDLILDQNEKIATALLQIVSMVREQPKPEPKPEPRPVPQTPTLPAQQQNSFEGTPIQQFKPYPPPNQMPNQVPSTPPPPKKHSLFHR